MTPTVPLPTANPVVLSCASESNTSRNKPLEFVRSKPVVLPQATLFHAWLASTDVLSVKLKPDVLSHARLPQAWKRGAVMLMPSKLKLVLLSRTTTPAPPTPAPAVATEMKIPYDVAAG